MPENEKLFQGTVITRTVGNYTVRVDGKNIRSTISSLLWKELEYPLADPASRKRRVIGVADINKVSPVAIGDNVELALGEDGSGRIRRILPRKNCLSRRASGPKKLEQVIVANIDLIVPVFALARPKPKWNLLDRYLAIAESTAIRPLICITKSDLAP